MEGLKNTFFSYTLPTVVPTKHNFQLDYQTTLLVRGKESKIQPTVHKDTAVTCQVGIPSYSWITENYQQHLKEYIDRQIVQAHCQTTTYNHNQNKVLLMLLFVDTGLIIFAHLRCLADSQCTELDNNTTVHNPNKQCGLWNSLVKTPIELIDAVSKLFCPHGRQRAGLPQGVARRADLILSVCAV